MDTTTLIKSWFEQNLDSVQVAAPATVHVDELLGLSMGTPLERPDKAVELGLELFRGLLEATSLDLARLMPVLVVTLEPTKHVELTAVSWCAISDHVIYEAPALYVVDRRAVQLPNRHEEYRCGIQPPADLPANVDFNSYYRCYRDPRAREQGWEFQRSLYLEAHHRFLSTQ